MVTNAPRRNMLRRKLFKDLTGNWKAFASMLILCMLSVTLWLGINSAAMGMEQGLVGLFAESRLADLWVSGEVSDQTARKLAALPGALDAQRRVRLRVKADLPGDPKLDLFMSDGDARTSKPLILEGGALPEGARNALLIDRKFANAMDVRLGDRLNVTAEACAGSLRSWASATVRNTWCTPTATASTSTPNTFGYGFVSSGTLADLPYNEVVVSNQTGVDPDQVKREAEELIDNAAIRVSTRDERSFIRMAVDEADQVRAMGEIFPAVFFLVAALITFSTMRRMIENQRVQLGTLYSLGYSRAQLVRHYASYGLVIALAGALFGTLGAHFFLGRVAMNMLLSLYVLPGAGLYTHPMMVAAASVMIVVIAMGASFFSCYQALHEVPAGLLRPRPPRSGRRVLLERITPLWKRLSFSNKLIMRNLFRNASRFAIGVIGVVGCSMLLLTGFGMRDSVGYVLQHYFTVNMRYDARVDLNSYAPDGYDESVFNRSGALSMERVMEGLLQLNVDNRWQQKSFTVLEDRHEMVYLEYNGQRVWLPEEGAAITERLAEDLSLKVGDALPLRMSDGSEVTTTVRSVIDLQLGQGVYFSRSAWRKLNTVPYSPTALFLSGGAINVDAVNDMDGVDKVRTIGEERVGKLAVTGVMDLLVLLMAIFAGALLLVVMYTLGELSFFERIRDLATLMVLGFTPRETKRLILRENIVVAVIGLPIGLLLGPYLHRWVLIAGLPSSLQFLPYISLESWISTGVLTLFFAWLVNRVIGAKFKSVNMVEALKSVE
jgi:putative ABC transport system permease protein